MTLGYLPLQLMWMLKGRGIEADPCGPPLKEWDFRVGKDPSLCSHPCQRGNYKAMTMPCSQPSGAQESVFFPLAEPPEVTMELSQQIIPWGQSAKFTCRVRGNPQPSVMWLRNAVPLLGSHRLRLSRRALRLLSVGPEDEGIYQCMAENEVGSAQAMVQLRTARPGKPLFPKPKTQNKDTGRKLVCCPCFLFNLHCKCCSVQGLHISLWEHTTPVLVLRARCAHLGNLYMRDTRHLGVVP